MKILVTGANGYIGQGVVKQLLKDHHEVIATDFSLSHVDRRATCLEANIFELSDPYTYFKEPDCAVHLAWRNGFIHQAISHMDDLPMHYRFIDRLLKGGLKQLAVLGTMHEIGFHEGCIDETTPTNPQSLYGITKNALRQSVFLLCRQYGAVFQWIRGYYIVGNEQYGSSIFSKIAAAEAKGDAWFPFTSGQNQWDFLTYDKFCQQICCIVEQTEVAGIINACSGYPEKLADRVEAFIKEHRYHIKLQYGAYPDRPYDSKAVWGSYTKIQRIMEKRYEKVH